MLSNISFQFGSNTGRERLSFAPESVTVFVGPNNSGKSLVLREIEAGVVSGSSNPELKIVKSMGLFTLSREDVEVVLEGLLADENGFVTLVEPISGRNYTFNRAEFVEKFKRQDTTVVLEPPVANLAIMHQVNVIRLDGQTRLSLVRDQDAVDLQNQHAGILQALLIKDPARKQLHELTHDAFGVHCVIDPTGMRMLRMRMSNVKPQTEETSLNAEAIAFFRNCKPLDQFSDGVKAYTGLIAALLSAEHRLILIDEPEAFLHPTLVRKLGRVLTDLASKRSGKVFASSHSADFLMGCVQSRRTINIVRLTYQEGVGTARLLSADTLEQLMRDPFLRSTNVLSALFHSSTVVSEADMDRAFYQEINERLLEAHSSGIRDCLFLNANGKQSIPRIVRPLRALGIPAAAIVDLDIISDGLTNLMLAAFVPDDLAASLRLLKDRVKSAFDSISAQPKKSGITALSKPERDSAENLIASLNDYGVFVVPQGEVEKWLPGLAATNHGPRWLSQVFELMGADPDDSAYIKPQENDVWQFVRNIALWASDPRRKGIPE